MNKCTLILLAILIAGCNKDEEIDPTPLLYFSVNTSDDTSLTDDWVVIHDERGKSITYKTFESGDQFVLESEKPIEGKTIGVTIVTYNRAGSKLNYEYNVSTYFNYEKGSKMTRSYSPYRSGKPDGLSLGTFNVSVTSANPLDECWISTEFGRGIPLTLETKYTLSGTYEITETASKFLISACDKQGNLRYEMISAKPKDSYSFFFEDMSKFDKTIEFIFPQSNDVYLFVKGREPGQSIYESAGYIHHWHGREGPFTGIKTGYLSSLSNYTTELRVNYPGYSYFYDKWGNVPNANVTFISPTDCTTSSKSIRNFSCASKKPLMLTKASFRYIDPVTLTTRVNWGIHSTLGHHTLEELPIEIITLHPLLNLDNQQYVATSFYTETPLYSQLFLGKQLEEYVFSGISITNQ